MEYTATCAICDKEFKISKSTYHNRLRNHGADVKFYCPEHKNLGRSIDLQKAYNKLSDEEKERRHKEASERATKQWASYDDAKRAEIHNTFSRAQKDRIDNMSPEELRAYKEERTENASRQHAAKTDEEKEEFRKFSSERSRKMWADFSDEKRDEIRQKQSDGLKRYIGSLTPEELAERNKRIADSGRAVWTERSEEEREELKRKLGDYQRQRWESMSDKERSEWQASMREGFDAYFADPDKVAEFSEMLKERHRNRTREEKESYLQKMGEWRASLSPEEWHEYNHRRLSAVHVHSSLCDKLIDLFAKAGLNKQYSLIEEYRTSRLYEHSWDYAIFDANNELQMIVDLDGRYFHADECDYDGIHSREDHDERRGLSIPDGVKWCIINEMNFDKGFEYLQRCLPLSYEEFIKQRFKEYRLQPFPEPEYSSTELLKSYQYLRDVDLITRYDQSLSLNTRNGDRIIQHFHHSLYDTQREAWRDDEALRKLINERAMYQCYLNKNKILQGLNVSQIVPSVRYMSAGKAKMIVSRYLSDYDTIFDPNMGWSGRMLGAMSLGKHYVGLDNNKVRVNETMRMLEFLRDYDIDFHITLNADGNEYPCLFTECAEDDIEQYTAQYKCDRYVFITNLYNMELKII